MAHARAAYRFGRYEEALKTLNRILEFVAQPNSDFLFHLSMTHARLGRMNKAREVYDRTVARMQETRDRRPDTKLFRREAAELLGIQP
jgi:Flp pilus assembly protein TadD